MKYIDICIALYDYRAQNEEELSFCADTILYVLDNSDLDWYKAELKPLTNSNEGSIGLTPSNYIEKIKKVGQAKALYDYEAQTATEISFNEDDPLTLYQRDSDESWCIVETTQGDIGLAPSNYVALAVVPPPPPPPEPNLLSSTSTTTHTEEDTALSWPVHEYDTKKKKKLKSKGHLLVGNGLVCFGSETSKSAPVLQYPIDQIKTADRDGKVVHIALENNSKNLDFELASQSEAKAVIAKINASHQGNNKKALKPKKWGVALYAFKPNELNGETYLEEHEQVLVSNYEKSAGWWTVEHKDGAIGNVPSNYVQFQEEYEASLKAKEAKAEKKREKEEKSRREAEEAKRQQEEEEVRLKKESETKMKEEQLKREEMLRQEEEKRSRKEAEEAKRQQEEEERLRKEAEDRKKEEEERLKQEAEAKERKRQEEKNRREIEERKQEEQKTQDLVGINRLKEIEEREKQRHAEAEQRQKIHEEAIQREFRTNGARSHTAVHSESCSPIPAPPLPPPPVSPSQSQCDILVPNVSNARTWTDHTGVFKVQARLIGCSNSIATLQKTDGVNIEVPVDQLSEENIGYIEKETGTDLRNQVKPFSWLDYFKQANLENDTCTEYAANFEANGLSERDIATLTHDQLLMLGVTEEHAQRMKPFLKANTYNFSSESHPIPPIIDTRSSAAYGGESHVQSNPYYCSSSNANVLSQIEQDEKLARELQEQEEQGYNRTGETERTYPVPPSPNALHSPQQFSPLSNTQATPSPLQMDFPPPYSSCDINSRAPLPPPPPRVTGQWNAYPPPPAPPQNYPVPHSPYVSQQTNMNPQFLAEWGGNTALAEANLRPVPAPPTPFAASSPLPDLFSSSSPNMDASSNHSFSPSLSTMPPQGTPDFNSSVGGNWMNKPIGSRSPPPPPPPQQQQPFYLVLPTQQPNSHSSF